MGIRTLSAATCAALITSLVLVATPAAAAPQSIGGSGKMSFEPGRYIVTLVEPSAATYEGGIDGFAPTAPEDGEQLQRRAVQKYTDHLAERQEEVAADADGVVITHSYTLALNGFAADLTADQAAQLAADRSVANITPDELKHVTAEPSTEFLGLSGPGGVWDAVGGIDRAGAGVVVGVLDTGVAPENPSFAGEALGTASGAAPYLDGDTIRFEKADGGTFTGTCETGVQFTAADCSTKIIGARYFVDGFGAIGDVSQGEYLSPRDGNGHGSHTASTAAGNAGVSTSINGVDFGPISGMAPAAKIAVYKVCWTGNDPTTTDDDGCATSDILSAIDQAVADGVDVLNYSIGGGAAQTTISPTDEAFLGAAAAGIFVAASAGNSGPASSTLDNASPWITTVAASTIPSYEATVTLGDGAKYAGGSITVNMDPTAVPLTGPLVTATAVALAGATSANLCLTGTLDPALTAGKIVTCERGVSARVDKSAEVKRAGGIGMILVNVVPGSVDLDEHTVPTIHLDARYHDAVMAYSATPDATATFTPGNQTDYTPPTPQVAGFSSRGPVEADGSDVLKPDISAPGVAILADGPNAAGEAPTFEFLSGTSMASPHIAGLAALYLGERPDASPAEIKSAMMTTAYNTVDGNDNPVTDPFIQGAGHVDPTKFFEPGLLYLNDLGDWLAYIQGIGYDAGVDPIDPSNLNLASIAIGQFTAPETITRTVTSTQAGDFTAAVSMPGFETVVEPSTLTFGQAGESKEFQITFTRTDAPLDTFSTGELTWTGGYGSTTVVRSPLAVRPVTIVAPAEVAGTGVTGSVDVTVTPGGDGPIPVSSTGLTASVLQPDPTGAEKNHSGSGAAGAEFDYLVSVPEGATFARFDLVTVDKAADLDLTVYLLNDAGAPIAGWQSATASGDERVDLVDPNAGTYRVFVDIYSVTGTTAFDLTTTSVMPSGEVLALAPDVLDGQTGVPVTFTASWQDLTPRTAYLGLIHYGDTGVYTVVTVATGEAGPKAPVNTALPTITGTPAVGKTLTATPGTWDVAKLTFTYQWQADGVDIAKATGKKYKVGAGDAGKAITVKVTASKKGLPDGTAVSEAVTVAYPSETSLRLNRLIAFSWNTVTAQVRVTSPSSQAPTGSVALTVNGKATTVPLTAADNGTVKTTALKLRRGLNKVQATFVPDGAGIAGSTSQTEWVWVVF